jgi:hypothetical protein
VTLDETKLDDDAKFAADLAANRARKRRSVWMTVGLLAFVVLIFVITVAKLGAGVLVRDL